MTLNQTGSLKPGTSGQSIQQIQQKKIDDLEDKVTELQEAIENLTGIIDNYAASFSTGVLQAEKINSPEIDAGNGSGTGQVTTDDLTVHDSAHIKSLQVDEIDGDLSLDGDLAADNVTASKVTAETVDASNGAGTGSVKTNKLTADVAEIGTLKTSGINGDLNVAGNASVTGNASITGGTSTDSVNTKSVTVHNADNTGTVTTDELNVTESARLAEAEIGEINGGLVVNGDIIADGVTTGDITANDITAASATADTVKAKIIAPKDGEEEVRHTASRSQFDHDVYVDGTLYVDTLDVGDLNASHAHFLGQSTEVTADSEGNFSAGKNASIGGDLDVAGDINLPEAIAGETTVSRALAALQNTKASVIDPISVSAIANGSSTADWSSCTALVNYIREHQNAPSILVVNASTTVYTLMLTSSTEATKGEEWIFNYKGLGINGSNGKPFTLAVTLTYLYTPNTLTVRCTCKEVALQEIVSAHATAIEANTRDLLSLQNTVTSVSDTASNAQTTANSALSTASNAQTTANSASSTASSAQTTANSASSTARSAQTTANSALSKANTNATNITTLQSSVASNTQNLSNLTDTVRTTVENFAPMFSDLKSYAVGEYVTYASELFKCTTAHSAGAWVASHFTQATVGEDIRVPWTTISAIARATVSSSTPNPDITLDSAVTFPAGVYWATAVCAPMDFTFLDDNLKAGYIAMTTEPFSGFTTDFPQIWFVVGANLRSSNIVHVSTQTTIAGGTAIGQLGDVDVTSGKSCKFMWNMTFIRLSTH